MKAAIRFLAVLTGVVVLSSHSHSQSDLEELEGIKSVRIATVFEGSEEVARACGITEERVVEAASFPVVTSQLGLREESSTTLTFWVGVDDDIEDVCAGSVALTAVIEEVITVGDTSVEITSVAWVDSRLIGLLDCILDKWDNVGRDADKKQEGARIDNECRSEYRFVRQFLGGVQELSKEFVLDWARAQQ